MTTVLKKIFFSALCLLTFQTLLHAQVKLPSIFTDNLVLQQQADVLLWGWADKNKQVSIKTSWNNAEYQAKANQDGRWEVKVKTPAASFTPYTISISDGSPVEFKNILIGEVWMCTGQSNMEMPMKGFKGQPILGSNEAILKSKNPYIRLYNVPRSSQLQEQDNSKPFSWKEAAPESVSNFSATGYYFGRLLQEMLQVPVGLINCSYGGSYIESWMSRETLKAFKEITPPKQQSEIKVPNRTPTTLYNGMLHPVIGYGIRGAIWYQGESNYERPDQYELLLPALVKEWRQEWNLGEFPFYYAQIAPFNYLQLPPYNFGGKFNSAYLRDAQRKSEDKISNAAMAVLLDLGEENSIHPMHKKEGGERLALLALANTYALKGFGAHSPVFENMAVEGSTASLKFKHADNGLTSFAKELQHFEIAGEDKQFYPAKAIIKGSTVIVSSPLVKSPVAVRYAFKDFVVGDLYSTEGLPVSSFRTDDF